VVKPQLVQDYIATGKATLEFRDLAFLGQESIDAAQAAACALDQGKFWQYHDTLYQNQNGENLGTFSKSRLKAVAKQMGLDTGKFNQCLDSGAKQNDVQAMINEARAKKVQQTPTFFVNDQMVMNYNGYDSLKAAIEAALNKK
jgi:protein-disulfide isomerase